MFQYGEYAVVDKQIESKSDPKKLLESRKTCDSSKLSTSVEIQRLGQPF